MKRFLISAFVCLTGALANASTISIPNNGSTVYFQENPQNPGGAVRTLGQTFMLPSPGTDNVLTGFSLALTSWSDAAFDYRAYLYEWDTVGLKATGPALFTSAAMNGTQPASFSGLSIILAPGMTYVALLTTEGVVNNGYSNGFLYNNSGDVYAGGGAYQQNSLGSGGSTGTGSWTSAAWTPLNSDFQFTANFEQGASSSAVPEPASFATIGLGGLAILGIKRFKKS